MKSKIRFSKSLIIIFMCFCLSICGQNAFNLNASGEISTYSSNEYAHINTYVYTCKGTLVLAKKYTEELTPDHFEYYENIADDVYNLEALKLGDPTTAYNCHSYAWYSQEQDNDYWIPYPEAFLTDGTYIQSNWKVGDIVVYYENGTPSHSAIIYGKENNTLGGITVISKWGAGPLYMHYGDQCPYTDIDGSFTFEVYRLCVHATSNHSYTQSSAYTHAYSCSTCGTLFSEAHTYNNLGRCIKCGYKGNDASLNGGKGELVQ